VPITVEIASPRRLVWRGEAAAVTGPGTLGQFGLLPGHRPLLASLRAGVVACRLPDGSTRRIAVASGFAELENDRVVVLTERALVPETDLADDEARAEARREATEQRDDADRTIRAWTGPISAREYLEARVALEWAEARLAVLTEES
jgi:F-type H+-transporting ATPase subunit epsilon